MSEHHPSNQPNEMLTDIQRDTYTEFYEIISLPELRVWLTPCMDLEEVNETKEATIEDPYIYCSWDWKFLEKHEQRSINSMKMVVSTDPSKAFYIEDMQLTVCGRKDIFNFRMKMSLLRG